MTAVVDKLLLILDSIAESGDDSMSLARLSRRTGIPKTTLYRLLGDLVEPGIIDHVPDGYALGRKLFDFGAAVPRYRQLRDLAGPYLAELAAVSGDTAHLATLRDREVMFIDRVAGRHHIRIPTGAGSRLPAACTALGKTLVAYGSPAVREAIVRAGLRPRTRNTIVLPHLLARQLAEIRRDGLAREIEEFRLGVGCIAAPIFDDRGAVSAAISVSGDPGTKRTGPLARRVATVAQQISKEFQSLLALHALR